MLNFISAENAEMRPWAEHSNISSRHSARL